MTLHHNRPVYLNLVQIRLPVAGVMSIIHRITGVVMVLAIPFLAWALQRSLSGDAGFAEVAHLFGGWFGKAALFAMCWALLHHLLAGVRYLLIDVDIGVEKPVFRYTAWAVLVAAPLLALLIAGGLS